VASSDVVVRLRMVGQAAFQAASAAAASGLERISDAGDSAGSSADALSRRMGKGRNALNSIGTMASRGALALGAAGVAAAGVGVKFNASMEQSKVAFTNLLGSSSEAEAMLGRLYKVAASTPFEFPQLVQSTQRLLGFGMAASKVEPTMKAVGDAVAAAGGGSEQIDRVSTALGQMQAKGKVSSEELLQLAESGVPALKILQDQLGLTGAQLQDKLQKGAIDANTGITALTKGIEKRYGGMAAAQSKTFNGMLSTLKDNATQVLGVVTQPLFTALSKNVLPVANRVTAAVGAWAKGGGVGRVFATMSKFLAPAIAYVRELFDALKPLQPFIQNILWPLLKGFAIGALGPIGLALKLVIPVVRLLATALGWIGQKARPLRGFFEVLGIVLGTIFGPVILKAFTLVKGLSGAMRVLQVVVRVLIAPFVGVAKAVSVLIGGFVRLAGRLVAMRGPIAGVARYFVDLISKVARLPSRLVAVGKAMVDALVTGITSAPGKLLDAIESMIPGGKAGDVIRKVLPGMAKGGTVRRAGVALVGEVGPELVHFPAGARVTPLSSPNLPAPALSGGGGGGGATTAHFYLDRRLVATAVAEDTADQRARRGTAMR
jgi:tape measure domain-containing protein